MNRVLTLMVAAAACARGGPAPSTRDDPVSIRFAIEVGPAVSGPVYVNPNGDGAPGWLHATLDGRRVYLRERCAIADCGTAPAVCGAPIPLVRDLTADDDRRVEWVWDGMVSTVDSAAGGCESMRPAAAGTYVVTLCYARQANLTDAAASGATRQGYLMEPSCVERKFTLADREVVLRL